MYSWHATGCTTEQLAERTIQEIEVAGKKVCLLKRGDEVWAFTALCPHAGAPLCDGWLDAQDRVVCPLHKYRFDPKTGRNTTGEGYKLFRYPVVIEDGRVIVGFL